MAFMFLVLFEYCNIVFSLEFAPWICLLSQILMRTKIILPAHWYD